MRLSVLDQSPIRAGRDPAASIRETVALAETCERLGYDRYWVSEHHNSPSVAGTAPEILIAAIAARTTTIRVGAAGVMLPHYASLKVAETFRVLDALAPGRIDLGLGRAPGADMATALALNPAAMSAPNRFGLQVQEVDALLDGHALTAASLVETVPALARSSATVTAEPRGATRPALWILGSSNWGAQAAAVLGLPYCYAWFFNDGQGAAEAMSIYRAHFSPSPALEKPHAAIAVHAIAADTEAEAWRLHLTREAWLRFRDTGRFEPLQDPATLAARDPSPDEAARLTRTRSNAIVGTPDQALAGLERAAASVGADEIAVVTACYDEEARRRSYTLLAKAAGLASRSA